MTNHDADHPASTLAGDQHGSDTPLARRAAAVLESITDPFYLLDEAWRFVYVNQRALEYLSMSREALVGRVLWDVFPDVVQSDFGTHFRRAVADGRTAEFETLSPVTKRVVEVRAYPSREGLSVSFRDVTERRRAESRDRFLVRLDDEMRALNDPEAITATAARLLAEQLSVDRCGYAEASPGSDVFDVIGDYSPGLPTMVGRYELSAFGGEIAGAMRRGIVVAIDDVERDVRTANGREAYRLAGIGAVIAAPLMKNGRFAGGLSVHQRTPRVWQPFEVELVVAVAHRCWESMERARLTRTLLRKTRAFSLLADNGTRLLSEEQPQTLIRSLFARSSELASADLCLHFVLSPDRTRLQLAASLGLPEGALEPGLLDLELTLCTETASSRVPIVRSRIQDGTDVSVAGLRALGVRAYACFPLLYDGVLIGTLSFGTRRRDAFANDDLDFLQALSDQVAAAYGRSRAATALRESEERLLQAAAIAGLGTFDTDFGTAEMTVNAPGRAIYGWDEQTRLTFDQAQRHFHPDDRERVVGIVQAALGRSGTESFDVEHRIVRTDGVVRWIRVRGRALFEPVGREMRPVRCLGTFVDITDRREADERRERMLQTERAAREEAERLGRLKDEFLATISHELRTPLNAILGWSQLLRRRPMGATETHNAIEVIDRNARAQAQLIDDLLDMSRFVSGNIRVDMQEVDLAMVVIAALQSVQPAAEAKRIVIRQTIRAPRATVLGDAARLQQVVWNLLSNAMKFTPPGGRIDVALERASEHVDLRVSDTGAGIRPDFLPHIFEPFRQQDASTTRRHGGVGLGLSIVKQLVEIHGGEVRATSEGEGRGSSFLVSLPLLDEAAEPPAPGVTAGAGYWAAPPRVLDGIRVLVVEDDADALALLTRVLEDAGAIVTGSSSATEALDRLQNEPVDLVVSDIGLPDVDGYDLVHRIRSAGGPLADVPAIAVTAYAHADEGIKARAAGFQRYLAKPVDVQEFVAVAAELVGR